MSSCQWHTYWKYQNLVQRNRYRVRSWRKAVACVCDWFRCKYTKSISRLSVRYGGKIRSWGNSRRFKCKKYRPHRSIISILKTILRADTDVEKTIESRQSSLRHHESSHSLIIKSNIDRSFRRTSKLLHQERRTLCCVEGTSVLTSQLQNEQLPIPDFNKYWSAAMLKAGMNIFWAHIIKFKMLTKERKNKIYSNSIIQAGIYLKPHISIQKKWKQKFQVWEKKLKN